MNAHGNPNVKRLPRWCIQLMMCFMRGFDKTLRFMFPPGTKYPNTMDSGAMEFCLFGSLTTIPVLLFGWNVWLMLATLFVLCVVNTFRYLLFYDIVDGQHRYMGTDWDWRVKLNSERPSSLT